LAEETIPPPAEKPEGEKPADPTPAPAKLFTQADLDRIVRNRLADEKTRTERRIADEKAQAEAARLAAQGEFKVLAEQRERELADLRAEVDRERLNTVRAKVAAEKKLTAWEASRLTGANEAELMADADEAIKNRVPPVAPNARNGDGGTPDGAGSKNVLEQVRAAALAEREAGRANSQHATPLEDRLGISAGKTG